jgi:hypothetical protein
MKSLHWLLPFLVGWYLILPPLGSAQTPISRWYHRNSYETAKECAHTRAGLVDHVVALNQQGAATHTRYALRHTTGMGPQDVDVFLSECVASDDPRLAR